MTSLTGCANNELSNSIAVADEIDLIDTNDDLISGVVQELDVPGEDFKLVVEYSCLLNDSEEWTVTGNKKLFTKIYTKGLPENKKVWLNDIHTDTSIMASIKQFDGIIQDTMDDGIHNSTLPGFYISDDTCYYGVNEIEGQNQEFIEGFIYGYQHTSGTIVQQRFLESDYLKKGVFANKISSVYGLLIEDNTKEGIYGVDVSSELQVKFCNKILMVDGTTGEKYYKIYERNDDGTVEVYTEVVGHSKSLN